jgi:hypothetical protein
MQSERAKELMEKLRQTENGKSDDNDEVSFSPFILCFFFFSSSSSRELH